MSSAPESIPAQLGAADRTATLRDLIRADDLSRCLESLLRLPHGPVGVALFDREGCVYAGATVPDSAMSRWEQLPPEAHAALRTSTAASFGIDDHAYDVRVMYAGTDRVGALVVGRTALAEAGIDPHAATDVAASMVGQLLAAGFATWVTSEMHLAASQSTHRALTHRNAELERAVEHLRELDELKSNFLGTVSHELRTPLTSVIGFSEMLIEGIGGELNAEQTEYVQTILNRGEELLALISQVLEMSQLEVGAVRLDLRALPLEKIVERAVEALQLSAEQASVSVETELGVLPPVLVDAEKLQRVVQNLVGNAIKFSPAGTTVRVTAALAPIRKPFDEETLFGEEADDAIRITVRDTGIGIPTEQLSRVFEAFYQVDASPTREHGGAGLGLSIVKNLVRAHGGDVWAESEVGVGTSIHFTVPIAVAEIA